MLQSEGELLYSILTCDLGDALQGGDREGEDDALAGPHPQQALTDQQAGDTNLTWNTNSHSTFNMTIIIAQPNTIHFSQMSSPGPGPSLYVSKTWITISQNLDISVTEQLMKVAECQQIRLDLITLRHQTIFIMVDFLLIRLLQKVFEPISELYTLYIHLIMGVNILFGLAWCQMGGAGGDVDFLQWFQGFCVKQVNGGALGEGHPNSPT